MMMNVSLVNSWKITRQWQYLQQAVRCVAIDRPGQPGPSLHAVPFFTPVLSSSYPGALHSLCFSCPGTAFPSFLPGHWCLCSPRSRAVCDQLCTAGAGMRQGGSWAGTGCSGASACDSFSNWCIPCSSSGQLRELQHRDAAMVSKNLISFLSTRLNNVAVADIWCVNNNLWLSMSWKI